MLPWRRGNSETLAKAQRRERRIATSGIDWYFVRILRMATSHVDPGMNVHENQIAREIVDASIQVHLILDPVLLESVYDSALTIELNPPGY